MPLHTVNFDFAGSKITIPGPQPGSQPQLVTGWVHGESGGLQRYVYRLTDATKFIWTLQFEGLSLEHKKNLGNFFATIAQGPTGSIFYTHTDGTIYSKVRFLNTSLDWVRNSPNDWSVQIVLELADQTGDIH